LRWPGKSSSSPSPRIAGSFGTAQRARLPFGQKGALQSPRFQHFQLQSFFGKDLGERLSYNSLGLSLCGGKWNFQAFQVRQNLRRQRPTGENEFPKRVFKPRFFRKQALQDQGSYPIPKETLVSRKPKGKDSGRDEVYGAFEIFRMITEKSEDAPEVSFWRMLF